MIPHMDAGSDTGRRIRTDRQAAGMTVRILADLIGVSPSHLRNVETGHRPVTVELAAAIAGVLGTDPERYDPSRGGDGT